MTPAQWLREPKCLPPFGPEGTLLTLAVLGYLLYRLTRKALR